MEDTIDYKPFFGLLEEPFNTVASPRFFYLSPIHAIALNKSVFTVDNRKGVSVVWGDIGTGKSTLARIMHERFLNKGYISVLLTNPGYISKNALIRTINEGFKIPPAKAYKDNLDRLKAFLMKTPRSKLRGIKEVASPWKSEIFRPQDIFQNEASFGESDS